MREAFVVALFGAVLHYLPEPCLEGERRMAHITQCVRYLRVMIGAPVCEKWERSVGVEVCQGGRWKAE